jgi:lysozyme family protein
MANFNQAFDKIYRYERGYTQKRKPYQRDIYLLQVEGDYHYADFKTAFAKTVSREGGYVSPDYAAKVHDSGGETYMGIARNYNPGWPGWAIIDSIKAQRPIKYNEIIDNPQLTQMVYDAAKQKYWDVIHGDQINTQPIGELIFELFWMSGGLGIKQVQQALNQVIPNPIKVDGVLGPDTLAKINSAPQDDLYSKMYDLRKNFYETKLAAGNPNAQGWLSRLASYPSALIETGQEIINNPGDIVNIAKRNPKRLAALGFFVVMMIAGVTTIVYVLSVKGKSTANSGNPAIV